MTGTVLDTGSRSASQRGSANLGGAPPGGPPQNSCASLMNQVVTSPSLRALDPVPPETVSADANGCPPEQVWSRKTVRDVNDFRSSPRRSLSMNKVSLCGSETSSPLYRALDTGVAISMGVASSFVRMTRLCDTYRTKTYSLTAPYSSLNCSSGTIPVEGAWFGEGCVDFIQAIPLDPRRMVYIPWEPSPTHSSRMQAEPSQQWPDESSWYVRPNQCTPGQSISINPQGILIK